MMNDLSPARINLYLREAWTNILGAPLLTLVAVLPIAVSLIFVGFFGPLLVNANHVLDAMAQEVPRPPALEIHWDDFRVWAGAEF